MQKKNRRRWLLFKIMNVTHVRLKVSMSSSSGEGYIFTCVLVFTIAIILTVTLKYTSVIRIADKSQTVVREYVESYLTQYSMDNFRKLRTGSRFATADTNKVRNGIISVLGVSEAETEIVIGAYSYRLKNVTVTVDQADHVSVKLGYTIEIPVKLLEDGTLICNIPMEVTSRLVYKN